MIGELFNNPISFLFYIIALIVAITIHEFAHAYAAEKLGDPTPRLMGRLTLNPLAHLDPVGTLMLLIARFGWGKPVPFDPFNLRNPRRDTAIISLAGPLSNLIFAVACSIFLQIILSTRMFFIGGFAGTIASSLISGLLKPVIIMCIVLGVFNLLPIHPLDGFKIVGGFLSEDHARQWQELEGYGMLFLIFLIFPFFGTSPIHALIGPPINFLISLLIPDAPLI